ncbi:hypothetical protein BVX97_04385, partial [bacterium E08(2017)]
TVENVGQLQHTFEITNRGDEPLNIEKIRKCCGATITLLDDKRVVPPGESAYISTKLNLKTRKGKLRKSIYVVSNAKNQKYFPLRFEGEVVAAAASPEEVVTNDVVEYKGTNNLKHAEVEDLEPVIIDYFYEPGCPECLKVKKQIMPVLEERFDTFYVLNRYDVGITTNVILLAQYQKELGIDDNESVSMYVDYQHAFNGFTAIKKGLFDRMDQSVAERMESGWKAPKPIRIPEGELGDMKVVSDRVKGFTGIAVILAGLADGINPCAVATLVFLMSVLMITQRREGRRVLLIGIPYIVASFVTYTALGFGLLRALHLMEGLETVRAIIEWLLLAMLVVFAVLSFRDAFRFSKSGKASDVTLQLPDKTKKLIHKVIRGNVRGDNITQSRTSLPPRRREGWQGERRGWELVIAGLIVGVLVTALESVCTGQVYVPTLALMIKEGQGTSRVWRYLLTYNVMFVMPLVVVFTLVYFGMRTEALVEWSKRNVVVSKCLLGVLFIVLALLMVLL